LKIRVEKRRDKTLVVYSQKRFDLLKSLRRTAYSILSSLLEYSIEGYVIGSVARGDVTENSDVDVFLPYYIPIYRVKLALTQGCLVDEENLRYIIVQATPQSSPRILVKIDDRTTISVPLSKLSKTEEEFLLFAGRVSLKDIEKEKRVPGVNKNLLMIEPVKNGHIEWSIIGREHEAARLLNISLETVQERVLMRTKRMTMGKAGLFIQEDVPPGMSPEEMALRIARKNRLFYSKIRETLL